MTLYIENETDKELEFSLQEIGDKVCKKVLETEECPFDCQINLVVTDNEQIQEMNQYMRNINAPTDVLSFPNLVFEQPGVFSQKNELTIDCIDPETKEIILGDIMISMDKLVEQAHNYGHSLMREYAFLLTHSMLHLCGYDHMEAEEASVMEAKQEEILNALGIVRE